MEPYKIDLVLLNGAQRCLRTAIWWSSSHAHSCARNGIVNIFLAEEAPGQPGQVQPTVKFPALLSDVFYPGSVRQMSCVFICASSSVLCLMFCKMCCNILMFNNVMDFTTGW